ncbi:MAG: triose-phosphate isomerase [Agitococcus sp.]|jgi:triosephosphate isomerase|nr:triose-phosphate isomerase [Agitococcus sp.]
MTAQRSKLVIGNWKMHGSFAANSTLLAALVGRTQGVDVAIAPPAVYLAAARQQLTGSSIQLAAQNVAAERQKGAYTGESSAAMLADVGVTYGIIGHSERRQYYGEANSVVAQKYLRLQEQGIKPVICVGESLVEREAGQVEEIVSRQLMAIIDACGVETLTNAVIAYEPVWAIGTGKTATPQDAQAVHRFLRQLIATHNKNIAEKICILYGGSVKADNAASLFTMPDIDGALVGGASLVASDFLAICHAAKASIVG